MIRIAKLSPSEKAAVDLIRDCRPEPFTLPERQLFARLACEARRAEMLISTLDSPYLGNDEATLLGLLTLLQRQRAALTVDIAPALLRALTHCADSLAERGIRLDYRNVARMAYDAPVRSKRKSRYRRARGPTVDGVRTST